ncbi:MAG: 2-oxoglutarate dehydrogenase complex dihydrolipoyllysine-residue succinyltransferase [Legionellaceae bacterium]|nr:2-oxoglutarate dehydrogenase complex dihydrolipoyllysine-residue succinyltransferase [Legionellaceae bacterium]
MLIEIKVPALPESVADATIAAWHKKPGDSVARDENLLDLETDKVVLEVPSTDNGVLKEVFYKEGDIVTSGQLLAKIAVGEAAAESAAPSESPSTSDTQEKQTSPGVRRLLAENELNPSDITGTGSDGRITKEDVVNYIDKNRSAKSAQPAPTTPVANSPDVAAPGVREERRVPMSRLRAKVAERLLEAQHNAAMLTTFNEVDLKKVMDLRTKYKATFEKKHGVKLGFMSFFTKAVVESLKRFPTVNASIDGSDVVYHGFYDIGIAVSTERGLVVPVMRDADKLSLADIESSIGEYAGKARSGKLSLEEMQGGTFTITNGGVFGSLLSMPILNPPQTAILGMHKIEERAVVVNGEIVIRPMMYLALSYDHRLVDGKDSVQFLVSVKELLEDPSRLLLNV